MIRTAGSARYPTIQEALSDLPTSILSGEEELILFLLPGYYREKLHITTPHLQIRGLGTPEECRIVYNDGAHDLDETGTPLGTFRTPTVHAESLQLKLENITIANTAGPGHEAGQAIALSLNCLNAELRNCHILGNQDTLFLAPLPQYAIEPNGFRGTSTWRTIVKCVSTFYDCYIEGNVDFIFGGGAAWFENCDIHSVTPDIVAKQPKEKPLGYISAASTPEGQTYGFVFNNCRLTSNCSKGSIFLGRPWRDFAKTIYVNCTMGAHIHPAGWHDWGKKDAQQSSFYAEGTCKGPGASTESRVSWSHQLTEKEAAQYRLEAFHRDKKMH